MSTDSILNGITFLDLGTSSLSSNNYTLSGVLAPCVNNVLSSIKTYDGLLMNVKNVVDLFLK